MSILSRFTVTPLLYTVGVLLLVIAGMGVALKLAHADVDVANAASASASALAKSTGTERDAWKADAAGALMANADYADLVKLLQDELKLAQAQAAKDAEESRKAIAAARADAADADRTLTQFAKKFQTESRKPTCARALEAMEASCPALSDY